MKFFLETGSFIGWLFRVLGVFVRIRPVTTFTLIVASALSLVMSILSAFLPLKVILLAANPTVPKYFPFVDPADRELWIIGFAVGTVFAYFLTLALDALTRKLAEVGSLDVLEGANDLAIIHNQRTQARTFYDSICGIAANFLFAGMLLAVLPLLSRNVFFVVGGLVVFSFLLTAALFGHKRPDGRPRNVSLMLDEKLSGYLGSLSSLVFFSGFAVLLYPYLVGEGQNVLLSFLAILLLRQLLNYLSKVVKDSVSVWKKRVAINPLVFPEHQLRVPESAKAKQLRLAFSKERREALVADVLEQHGIEAGGLQVHWFDPLIPRINLFDILVESDNGEAQYQMQIFPAPADQHLVSEDFLFDLIPRADLLAPPVIARFHQDPYEIQICASGHGMDGKRFEQALPGIREKIWQVRPPDSLVNSFARSRPLLSQRLDEETVKRMELAVDTDDDARIYGTLLARLSLIHKTIEAIPLVIVNLGLGPRSVAALPDGNTYYVMSWGRWTLEPLGASLTGAFDRTVADQLLSHLRKARADINDKVTVDHLWLAQQTWVFERTLARGAYRQALGIAATVIVNPLLQNETDENEPELPPGTQTAG